MQEASINAIEVDGLWWRYPTYNEQHNPWTLRDVTLRIEQGSCFGITGPSGAGKSTLCRILLGILPFSARLTSEQLPHYFRGSVQLLGQPVTANTASLRRIGMVMQDPENQFLRMSLLHELGLGLQIQGVPNEEILRRSYEALRWVGLEHLWHGATYLHPADLSGGQKQRVAIAAFLAMRPDVLILDEPTSDLDPVGKREVIETLVRLRRDYHITAILVEQDPEILTAFCDHIALLHKGHIEQVAPPATFYKERDLLLDCGASAGELARISWHTSYTYDGHPPLTLAEGVKAFAPAITQGRFAEPPQQRPVSAQEALVTATNVHYVYEDGTTALKNVDMDLYRGEMLALLGPNGSGKTTFAKILAGIYRATQGRVQILGQDMAARKARHLLARSVGYVFQNPDHQLFCRKVKDEIEYGLKNLGMEPAKRRERTRETLEAVNLLDYADEDPLFLSKGQRQRLAVAAILAMGPEILIVDEPTTGQDYQSIQSIMHLLRDLQRQQKTILIITHDMTLVAEHCQRVIAFRDGLVSFTGTPAELFEQPAVLQRTGLYPPLSAQLTMQLRRTMPQLPSLLTVDQWTQALKLNLVEAEG
jgi:energy-coupling factor transporter ATP-binding protein EcfA2